MLCAQRVLSRSTSMYLPSYAVNKGRFSSSWNTTYCKLYYNVLPSVKFARNVFGNSGNSILLHVIPKLFSAKHPPAFKIIHVWNKAILFFVHRSQQEEQVDVPLIMSLVAVQRFKVCEGDQIHSIWIPHDRVSFGSKTTKHFVNFCNMTHLLSAWRDLVTVKYIQRLTFICKRRFIRPFITKPVKQA